MDELLKVYYGSVGGNSTFLLNLPPDTRGLIHENDAARMKEFGNFIREIFKENLAANAEASASESIDKNHSAQNMFDGNKNTYWCPREGIEKCNVKIDLKYEREFDKVILQEHIKNGQRVEKFTLEYWDGHEWKLFYSGTVIGYKRICCFDKVISRYIKFTITNSRWCPEI